MKLQQLRYLHEVARQDLNITNAAEVLFTSQPGVSKQIQLFEEEIGLQVFLRNGKRLTGITEPGQQILSLAAKVMHDVDNIKRVGDEFSNVETGMLTIATTHTQARYKLPTAIKAFMTAYPHVKLNIHQGNPSQVAEQVSIGDADIGIATEYISDYENLLCLPCYQWNRCVVVPHGHPLLLDGELTLEKLTAYPLITYDFGYTGGSLVSKTFSDAGLSPNVVLTAIDADVIKTYVTLGLGVGLLANMAYDPERDANLAMVDVSHLFPDSTTYLGVRKDAFLRGYMYGFIELIAPHFNRQAVNAALKISA
ncbi:CysB family HTH-type transcriptional regulator [Methylotenera sp.]|uniref:CysB family HTH-type transcriptional regulator n=1 Tax=Methylotenera sp. TaxID=2051956 RepID=UPI0027240DBB|nr:CysB family HTH-type transcriptional regulator [Methylotenera sp.]MDO9206007.1 CysB family HTH-type transcriptional regulator [Methylotenera sp.]MDO9393713.1 CysB family HTH-type transcriptional regulator [Methylotenera sp.]MDP1522666.1 CysB family HTH-type transcriptional regulator [Methylotenera sp.]MDP2071899.1 CysB family HTH-type transcriptional regulator [Methylotenera sp.]MDP3005524.1 CysB family HTH-type transcriptional regulator [Methylotenera sp.]